MTIFHNVWIQCPIRIKYSESVLIMLKLIPRITIMIMFLVPKQVTVIIIVIVIMIWGDVAMTRVLKITVMKVILVVLQLEESGWRIYWKSHMKQIVPFWHTLFGTTIIRFIKFCQFPFRMNGIIYPNNSFIKNELVFNCLSGHCTSEGTETCFNVFT